MKPDWLIDGKVDNWPCSIWIVQNYGQRGVSLSCAPYTDDNDNSAPQAIRTKLMDIEGDFASKREALAFAKGKGFVPATGDDLC